MSVRLAAVNEDGSFKYEKTNKFIENNMSTIKQRVEETNNSIISSDGSFTVNTDYAVNVVSGDVDPVDGFIEGTGQGTLLYINRDATRITWPGGTVVHGRPGYLATESFTSIARIGDAVHVVWSAVDQTPPPGSGVTGTGAVQASLSDVLRRRVPLPPGGTVVSDPGGWSLWQFTNLDVYEGTELVLTHGRVEGSLYKEMTPSEYIDVSAKAGPFAALEASFSIGFSTGVPETGSGVVVAISSTKPVAGDRARVWSGIRQAFQGLAYDVPADVSNPGGERWLVVPITTKSMSAGMVSSGDSLDFSKNTAMDVFKSTIIYDIEYLGLDDAYLSENGITMSHRVLTPAEMAVRKPAWVTW